MFLQQHINNTKKTLKLLEQISVKEKNLVEIFTCKLLNSFKRIPQRQILEPGMYECVLGSYFR